MAIDYNELRFKEISSILNTQILPKIRGDESADYTVATDLSNISDFGKLTSNLTSNDLLDNTNTFVFGSLKTIWNRVTSGRFSIGGIVRTFEEYGAVTQSIYRKTQTAIEEVEATNLVNGQTYAPKYYGVEFDVKIFNRDSSFRMAYSIPKHLYDSAFTNPSALYAFLEQCVADDVDEVMFNLELTTLQSGIAKGKTINLVTLYNTEMNLSGSSAVPTGEKALLNTDFTKWMRNTLIKIRTGMTRKSKIYNDGTVYASTPLEKNRLVILDMVERAFETSLYSNTYNLGMVQMPKHDVVPYWQNMKDDMVPTFENASKVSVNLTGEYGEDGEGDESITKTNVVGFAFTEGSLVASVNPTFNDFDRSGRGSFTTYYQNYGKHYTCDTRANMVAFTLN